MNALWSKRAEELFEVASTLPPQARADFLEDACGKDRALRNEVASLLSVHDHASHYFDSLGKRLGLKALLDDDFELPQQDEIGPYRLIRLLGRGGMGAVYLAERSDGLIKRPVALKLPQGAWQTTGLAERMAREREILASLSHPNIAHLYDAGVTPEGQPYLALEYVEGSSIDEYCREHKLGVKARLALFLQAAKAVAHAHAQLVVHRDLKPANILVTQDRAVKLLDFGIAKLLEHGEAKETKLTKFAGRALTPEYASPEQIAGKPITTASDVYSLGVLLHELLTGTKPYRLAGDSPRDLEEAILRAEPTRPSEAHKDPALRRALRGDLDTIVLKALKKEPAERYATVNAFVEDLQRHLDGRPLLARPDSAWYIARKLVGRNKLAVSAATAVLAAVLIGAGVSLWQARIAIEEKERAEQVKEFIASIFRTANPYETSDVTVETPVGELLKQAEQRFAESEGMPPETRIELMIVLTDSTLSLQGKQAAVELARRTVDEATRTLGAEHTLTLHARALLGSVLYPTGRLSEIRGEVESLPELMRKDPKVAPEFLVMALTNRAHLALGERDYVTAVSAAQQALTAAETALGQTDPATLLVATLLTFAYQGAQQDDLALKAAERVYRLTFDVLQLDPRNGTALDSRIIYGMALAQVGEYERGLREIALAIDYATEVYGADAQVIGFYISHLARFQSRAGLVADSVRNHARVTEIIQEKLGRESPQYVAARANQARALIDARRGAEAERIAADALLLTGRLPASTPAKTDSARLARVAALAYSGRLDEAGQILEQVEQKSQAERPGTLFDPLYVSGIVSRLDGRHEDALRAQRASLRAVSATNEDQRNQMHLLTEIGLNELALGDAAAAEITLRNALVRYQDWQPYVTPSRTEAMVGLAQILLDRKSASEALPLLETAAGFWRDFDSDSRWSGEVSYWLGRCHAALGRHDEADLAMSRAAAILGGSPFPGDATLARFASRHRAP